MSKEIYSQPINTRGPYWSRKHKLECKGIIAKNLMTSRAGKAEWQLELPDASGRDSQRRNHTGEPVSREMLVCR